MQCLAQCRSKAALQCWPVSPYWPVCVSECSCVRTVSDLLGEFSHFSAATWLSCLPLGQSRAGQTCIRRSQHIHIWERLFLQITQSHLAQLLSEQNCSCRSEHLGITTLKVATFEGFLFTERRQPPGWVAFWRRNTFAGRISEIVYVYWIATFESLYLLAKPLPISDRLEQLVTCEVSSHITLLCSFPACVFNKSLTQLTRGAMQINVQMYNREPCITGQYSNLNVQLYDGGSW